MKLIEGERGRSRQQEDDTEQCFPTVLFGEMYTWLRSLGEVSPLTKRDAEAFLTLFRQEEPCYANSWSYVLRSTRTKGEPGYKFVGGETIMGIGFRHNVLYLVNPRGPGRFQTTLAICRRMYRSLTYP